MVSRWKGQYFETAAISKRLLNRRPEFTATVGIQLLKGRQYFEKNIVQNIEEMNSRLKANEISDVRVCANYSVPLGGLLTLVNWLENDLQISVMEGSSWIKNVVDIGSKSALEKLGNANTELPHAEEFLEKLDEEVLDKSNRMNDYGHQHASEFAAIDGDVIIAHVNRALDEWRYPHQIRPLLKKELHQHERFLTNRDNSSVFNKKKEKVWKFQKLVD